MVEKSKHELPIPRHFDPEKVSQVWKVDYQCIAEEARKWADQHDVQPASHDSFKICLIAVDVQNTFCIPDFELFVQGKTGKGAVSDNQRLCEFIYRNLNSLTQIVPTMDTHQAMQIFHSIFLVNESGEHPSPFTHITREDIAEGRWKFNELLSHNLKRSVQYVQNHLLHYTEVLRKTSKYALTIWPYHAMFGGIGHALVSSIEEAIFFHTIARYSQPHIHVKGDNPLTEHYSVLAPEVRTNPEGEPLEIRTQSLFKEPAEAHDLIKELEDFDVIIIAGQAKSHCVAWTLADFLDVEKNRDRRFVQKVYILEDCTSPVVIPGLIDYSEEADLAFKRFEGAGMHIVRSTEPIRNWPGIKKLKSA